MRTIRYGKVRTRAPLRETPKDVVDADFPSAAVTHPIKYRSDIDGLRAIAVTAVILYHMFPTRLPAGGVGVDIFFVISGYLVGGIVMASVAANQFSFRDFYARRARRILPALLVMVIFATVVAFIPMYPWELTDFAKSGLSSLAGVANIFFFFNTDYFAAESGTLPLLHNWSLGVEEQFYLVFPFVIIAINKFNRKRVKHALGFTILLSIVFSSYQVKTNTTAAFYLLPSRWWELAIGAFAAQAPKHWLGGPRASFIFGSVGLALIAASLLLVRPEKGFPGPILLPACIGTALFLISGYSRLSLAHRLVTIPPVRLTGLASYSLYLWHWPIIVFYKQIALTDRLTVKSAILVGALTVLFGFGSWHFVERPFRSKMPAKQLALRVGALFALSAALLVTILICAGFPQRLPPQAIKLAQVNERVGRFPMPTHHCFLPVTDKLSQYDARCLERSNSKPDWLLVGDSHAAMLWTGLVGNLPQIHFQTAVVFGCEIPMDPEADGPLCNSLMHQVMVEHVNRRPPSALVLTWRWLYIDEAGLKALYDRLKLRGVQLIIIGPTPEYGVPVPRLIAESIRRNQPDLLYRSLSERTWNSDRKLQLLSHEIGYTYLSPLQALCSNNRRCTVEDENGKLLYFDKNHFNELGSNFAVRKLIALDDSNGSPLKHSIESSWAAWNSSQR